MQGSLSTLKNAQILSKKKRFQTQTLLEAQSKHT